ncbi:hypothetical protein D8T51_15480 [Vibrio vulnificus]|jgi:hypothetical protein|uniref:YbbD head domain-containing protein n=1 Tax=Vibrio vulnificus TaxID=672 RepID=A0ABX4X5V9_VIBVL|nr:hypothetical protein [Vibrio vulnificus]AVX01377.1 hypothetical protein BJD94_15975 [Vibrio vulnificus Env1]EGQ7693164.1 hypothetical protein [Vibrio vulnificus]EGQ7696330.1 hypothetical protein [Vibrio vulnificus]EGQ7932833.1 hypothetical protein [Vibrio vulnificus]EGQ7936709.1 hypothetical protein [Vibrio vulnificus]
MDRPMKARFLLLLLVLTGCSDIVQSHYDNYQQAQADQLFERGWLPDVLPVSTTQIEVANDLDNNTSQGSFLIAEKEMGQFLSQLQPLETANQYRFESDNSVWIFTLNEAGKVSYQLSEYRSEMK